MTVTEISSAGFPHSDIHGSPDMCSLPWLFAAYRVLLRLLVPRHPPYALLRLINSSACPMLNCVSSSMKPSVSSHNLPPSAFFHAKPLFEVILFFGSFLSLLKLIFSRTESSFLLISRLSIITFIMIYSFDMQFSRFYAFTGGERVPLSN